MNQKKQSVVENLQQQLTQYKNILVVGFDKTSHKTLEVLRRKMYPTDTVVSATKNTLFEKAVHKASHDIHDLKQGFPMKQNNLVIFFKDNWNDALKALADFIKKEESLAFKFGLFDGTYYQDKQIKVLATLPGKKDFMGKFAYLFKSGVSRSVFAGKYPMMALVNVLKQKAQKG